MPTSKTHQPTALQEIRFPHLRPARSVEEFALHNAALEWSLDAPIAIDSEADIESRRHWQGRFQPYAHQIQNLITFCRRAPVALLADDVGLGKTISAGLIISELMTRRKISRTLVVCPKLLLPQWCEEMLSKFDIEAAHESGVSFKHLLRTDIPVSVTTYDTARRYFSEIQQAGYQMLVLDEAHKLRNLHGTANPPQFAEVMQNALRQRVFKYVLMLTATPIQNRLWDLYSLVDLLTAAKGHTNPLGSPATFKARYLADGSTKATKLHEGRAPEFRAHLAKYIVRTRREDAQLKFPERQVKLVRAKASSGEVQLLELVTEMIRELRLNGLTQTSIAQALMSSPEALRDQLTNMAANRSVPTEYAERANAIVMTGIDTGKLTRLKQLIEELATQRPDDWRVVVFCTRKATQEAIGEFLHRSRIPFGYIKGASAKANQQAIRDLWSDPPVIHVLVSTDSGAEGVNLQVANVLVNYDLPWNPMVVEQRIGRIQRLASNHAYVTVLNLVVAGSVEERIVGVLSEKLQAISQSIGDVESILESAGGVDDAEGMEALIRNLVIKSLKGQDTAAAMAKAAKSIERGRQIFDDEREAVEQNLGKLDELHRVGPRPPAIKPITPSIKLAEFVFRTLAAEGATVETVDDELWRVTAVGRPQEFITFNESTWRELRDEATRVDAAVFSPVVPRLHQLGSPAFERLAQSWSERHAAYVADAGAVNESCVQELAERWAASLNFAELEGMKWEVCDSAFRGDLTCRACGAVAHDRFEKLVIIAVGGGVAALDSLAEGIEPRKEDVDSRALCSGVRDEIEEAIRTDSEMAGFVQFYTKRLEEETEIVGANPASRLRVREQLTPRVDAEIVSVRGLIERSVRVQVALRIDGHGPYEASFRASGEPLQMIAGPAMETCVLSGRIVPESCLETCVLTGQRALRHLLRRSDVSGQYAQPDRTRVSEASGLVLLETEAVPSDVSGRLAAIAEMCASACSDRRGLPDEVVACEFTGDSVLVDETAVSDVSGKRYRKDQRVESAASGVSGHQSELLRSVDPAGWLLPSEAGRSDLSGDVVAKAHLVASDRLPHRSGYGAELARCEVTQRVLLRDEVQVSAVSGTVADSDLMVQSDASMSWMLRSEAIECQLSGKPFLPKEVATCAITGKLVDARLTTRSEVSGRRAITQRTGRSGVSGVVAIEDELATCALTGVAAVHAELDRCEASGRVVDKRRLGRSEVSGKQVVDDLLIRCSHTGRCALEAEMGRCAVTGQHVVLDELELCAVTSRNAKHEFFVSSVEGKRFIADQQTRESLVTLHGLADGLIVDCPWLGQQALPGEYAPCKLLGVAVSRRSMNAAGELSPLRALLDGRTAQSELLTVNAQWAAWARATFEPFEKCDRFVCVSAPSKTHMLIWGRVRTGFAGMGAHRFGALLVKLNGAKARVEGRRLLGVMKAGRWRELPAR